MRIGPSHVFTALTAVVVMAVVWMHYGTDDGLSSISTGISETLVGESLKSTMARSEKLWQKTVRQRHEVMAKFGEMGLYVIPCLFFSKPPIFPSPTRTIPMSNEYGLCLVQRYECIYLTQLTRDCGIRIPSLFCCGDANKNKI